MSKGPRILLWDIETDGIQADRVICIGYKWHKEKKVHMLRAEDYPREGLWDDKGLMEAFVPVFEACDWHATWYGARFDLPVIKTRMIQHRMKPLPPKPHLDLWRVARKHFRLYSNRLAAWQDHLGLRDDKTPIKPSVWVKARTGHGPALKYIYEHCHQDVLVLEQAFEQLRPWTEDEPARGLFTHDHDACPSCGSKDLRRRGYKAALTRVYQQFVCNQCGRWFRPTKAEKIVPVRSAA